MVANGEIKSGSQELVFDALPKITVNAFKKCAEINFFSDDGWYLAGGTALALQTGHRQSVDLDFFTQKKDFDTKKAEEILSISGQWTTTSSDRGTLYGEFFGAKMSLIAYPFFKPAIPMLKYGTISLVTSQDIAIMKIIAISQRGRKRDFFDLFWICKNISSLYENIMRVDKQYSIDQNLTHILKSLVYFEDAEGDPEPEIYFKSDWKEVKAFFEMEVPRITRELIGLN